MIFLAVGNVVLATGTSVAGEIRGVLRRLPVSGVLLVIGLFAVTGSPPFGMFISEFTILAAALDAYPWVAAVVVILLAVIFVGIAAMILEMVYGVPPAGDHGHVSGRSEERTRLVVAPAVLAVIVLGLGLYLPGPLADALSSSATVLGGRAP
jgi:hydrogenase-4 component F